MYSKLYVQLQLNSWNKTQIKKLLWFKREAFIADSIPGKRFNFAHFNFPGKFLLSYNTAMVYTGCYQFNPMNSWNKTQIKKLLRFKRRAFIAESISVKRFNFAHFNFPGKFLLSYNTAMVYTECYQCNPTKQLKQSTNQKLLWFKRKAFIAEFIPVKRFNFAHFNFPRKFLLIYNTAMVYTWCYQCNPPEQLKQNTNKKTAPIQKKSFYCWVYSSKKIQLCSFQLSWKIPFVLQHSNGIYWMLSVQPPWTAETKYK